jgi:hypothetical protein
VTPSLLLSQLLLTSGNHHTAACPQGDACNLPSTLQQFDAVLAANLLCRLPDPMLLINRLPTLVCMLVRAVCM